MSIAPIRYSGLDAARGVTAFTVILYHVVLLLPVSHSLDPLVRARDFGFPVIALSSLFALTRALALSPTVPLSRFIASRFYRLELPLVVWTLLYWIGASLKAYVVRGDALGLPPFSLFISGYWHLWFLQFLFVSALLLAPLIRMAVRNESRRRRHAAMYGIAASVYLFVQPQVSDWIGEMLGPSPSPFLGVLGTQSERFAAYVPLGVALALMVRDLEGVARHRLFQIGIIAVSAIALAVHVISPWRLSREIMSVTIFLLLLQPFAIYESPTLLVTARYSYGIYLIHFAIALAAVAAVQSTGTTVTVWVVLGVSALVFGVSFAAARLLRAVWPADWLIPLVRVADHTPYYSVARSSIRA